MTKRMLIDASHEEETRVVLLDGNRIEDYDVETFVRRQLKGNIYLAKVIRVEPSLQAAFVEYGGNRHGFLAFGEIHPDYYQIPIADRQRLIELQEAEAREEEEAEDRAATRSIGEPEKAHIAAEATDTDPDTAVTDAAVEATVQAAYALQADPDQAMEDGLNAMPSQAMVIAATVATETRVAPEEARTEFSDGPERSDSEMPGTDLAPEAAEPAHEARAEAFAEIGDEQPAFANAEELLEGPLTGEVLTADEEPSPEDSRPAPEAMGGEQEEQRERRPPPRFLRNYKIQEVIRRRQIMLVQVVKEERGTKGAALTTYISLAGRFSVLMPNSPRGGGISRKITSAADRRRLKEVTTELALPRGMGIIVRTAGANRPKPEIMRDCEYLLNQWDQIRDLTLRSVAPALIYEEASLIKRAMRDLYTRDVEDVQVEGEAGWKAARDFMRMLMPDAARKIQLWREPQPLFAKHQVEHALDAMLAPNVQLRSGGYLIINQTEALVAIDVNSGRSTRERGIEETALRTNLEAADEVARQLRLRDLAGLIVIDFIDMESRRHNAMVERRLKDALKNDRARIQVGSISHFGLMEMSRQRLRPSLAETNFVACPACGGLGHIRSAESSALHVLRAVEEEGAKRRASEIVVYCGADAALYVLNHKRSRLAEIESRFGMDVAFAVDHTLFGAQVRIDRVRTQTVFDVPPPISQMAPMDEEDAAEEAEEPRAATEVKRMDSAENTADLSSEEADQRRKRRRRRGRGRSRDEADKAEGTAERVLADFIVAEDAADEPAIEAALRDEPGITSPAILDEVNVGATESSSDLPAEAGRRRRSRRGGRRRNREDAESTMADADTEIVKTTALPVYEGPTPANPFGGAYDIFEVLEQAERARAVPTSDVSVPEPPGAAASSTIEASAQHATAEADLPPDDILQAASDEASGNGESGADVMKLASLDPPPPADTAASSITAPQPDPVPIITPVIVGNGDVAATPRRGWWRR